MKYLLDTNICIALLKGGDERLLSRFEEASTAQFFLCSIVKAELFYGARKSQRVEANLKLLDAFFTQFESLVFDDKASEFYGVARSLLAKMGMPVGANDLLIASIAQSHDLTLISRNEKELRRIPGLRLEAW